MGERDHKRNISRYTGKLPENATEAARLTYDRVSEFIGSFADELDCQSEADFSRGRPRLARALAHATKHLTEARTYIDEAWDISMPHLRPEELRTTGLDECLRGG